MLRSRWIQQLVVAACSALVVEAAARLLARRRHLAADGELARRVAERRRLRLEAAVARELAHETTREVAVVAVQPRAGADQALAAQRLARSVEEQRARMSAGAAGGDGSPTDAPTDAATSAPTGADVAPGVLAAAAAAALLTTVGVARPEADESVWMVAGGFAVGAGAWAADRRTRTSRSS